MEFSLHLTYCYVRSYSTARRIPRNNEVQGDQIQGPITIIHSSSHPPCSSQVNQTVTSSLSPVLVTAGTALDAEQDSHHLLNTLVRCGLAVTFENEDILDDLFYRRHR